MDQSNRLESGGRRELAQGFESSTLRHIKRRSDGMADVTSSNLVVRKGVRVRIAPSAPFCNNRTSEDYSVVQKYFMRQYPNG